MRHDFTVSSTKSKESHSTTTMPSETAPTTIEPSKVQAVYGQVVDTITRFQESLDTLKLKVLENPNITNAAKRTNELISAARVHTETALAAVRAAAPESTTDALAKATALLAEIKTISAEKYTTSLEAANKLAAQAFASCQTWSTFVLDFALTQANSLDTKFQLATKANTLLTGATELLASEKVTAATRRVSDFDTQYKVVETTLGAAKRAQEIGDSLTGARITPWVEYLTTMAVQGYTTGINGVTAINDVVTTKAEAQANASSSSESKENSNTDTKVEA